MTFGMLPQIAFPPFKGLVLQNKHWYPIPQVFSVKTQCINKSGILILRFIIRKLEIFWYPFPQIF